MSEFDRLKAQKEAILSKQRTYVEDQLLKMSQKVDSLEAQALLDMKEIQGYIEERDALKAQIEKNKQDWDATCLGWSDEIDRLRAQLKVAIQILREEVVEGIDFDIAKLRAKSALSQLEG